MYIYVYAYIYIYVYIFIHMHNTYVHMYICICIILSRINRTTINSLLKVSDFFHNLQVKCFTYKNLSWFLVLESFVNYPQTSGNRRIFFNYYY